MQGVFAPDGTRSHACGVGEFAKERFCGASQASQGARQRTTEEDERPQVVEARLGTGRTRFGEESLMSSLTLKMLVVALVVAASAATPARGGEPVEQFVSALRGQKFYDEALDYLQLLETKARLPADVRQQVAYQRGVTLAEIATRQGDVKTREQLFARAAESLAAFQNQAPDHPLAAAARNQLASLTIDRARLDIQSARETQDKKKLVAARAALEQARQHLNDAEKHFDAQLGKLPKLIAPEDAEQQAQKRQLADGLSHLRLLRASIDFEQAETFAAGSADAKKHLKAAAEDYAKLFEAYRTRSVGLVARLSEGRCYQQLEQFKQALGCFGELMELPTSDETRVLKTKSTRYALECWTKDSQKKFQEAVEAGERWEKELGAGQTDADALAIRYLTAVAYQAQAKSLPAKDPTRKKLTGFARQYVGSVADHPGEYQRPAKMMLVALAGGKETKPARRGTPTFAEVFEQSREALEKMQIAAAQLEVARGEKNQEKVALLEKQKGDATAQALELLRVAVTKSDAKTPIEDLNSARYYLCFLAWDAGQYYDAAVLGEFLARNYGETSSGQQGAKIALAAYVRLFGEAKGDDKQFEQANVERISQLIFKRWPNQAESDEAALTLLNLAASQNDVDRAVGYLSKIVPESPRRGAAELRAGQALWSAYLRTSRAPEDTRPPQEKLDAMKSRSQEILAQGIARFEKAGEVDAALATAVLSMAQICVETGQPDKAISWLENAKLGPLTLVKAKHPAVARDVFATEAYKMALRAYIAVTPQQLDKAEQAMDALEKLAVASGDAKAGENLTAIYISLGRELGQHLEELRKSKKTKELAAVSKAFEVFLDRVTKRDAGGSYTSLNWVAETYCSLGRGYDQEGSPVTPQSRLYYQKAAAAYEKMLELATKDPKYKDQPDALIALRLRTADCQRRGGEYDRAIQNLVGILKDKPALLTAQVQAAETYQAKGTIDSTGYALAITGGSPGRDGKNVVWGWGKLSKMMASDPKFEEQFHQARLNMAQSRLKYALVQTDADKRTKILNAAKQDLWFTYKLHPTLGGEATLARYDGLLKQIQKNLGEKEAGLAEFKQRDQKSETPAT